MPVQCHAAAAQELSDDQATTTATAANDDDILTAITTAHILTKDSYLIPLMPVVKLQHLTWPQASSPQLACWHVAGAIPAGAVFGADEVTTPAPM